VHENVLYSNDTVSAPIELKLRTTKHFSVTRVANIVCPIFHVLNTTGCYGCSIGFEIEISAYSECLAGPATTSLKGTRAQITSSVVELTNTAQTFVLQASAQRSPQNLELCLHGTKEQVCQTFEIDLVFVEEITTLNEEHTAEAVNVESSNFIKAKKSFGKLFWPNWKSGLLNTTFLLLACFFILPLGWGVGKMIHRVCLEKTKKA